MKLTKRYLGATILATVLFWALNIAGGIFLESQGFLVAMISASWKAAIFGFLFHILHNSLAGVLGWYEDDAG